MKEEIKVISGENEDLRNKYQIIRLENNKLSADFGNQK